MPGSNYDSKLRAVLSYYEGVVSVTPEGESLVSGESLEGLGTGSSSHSFLYNLFDSLFGSLLRVASIASSPRLFHRSGGSPKQPTIPCNNGEGGGASCDSNVIDAANIGLALPLESWHTNDAVDTAVHEVVKAAVVAQRSTTGAGFTDQGHNVGDGTSTEEVHAEQSFKTGPANLTKKKFRLTNFAPDPGYFLAGAIAGGVSRSATAPLDRLKVYLLVSTKADSETALAAIKQGRPINALKNATRPFMDAVKELYRSGGVRGFFAGKFRPRWM